jgi:hypothetical protein
VAGEVLLARPVAEALARQAAEPEAVALEAALEAE